MGDLWWGFWTDYQKVYVDGRQYAQIGGRLYTEHAVIRFLPSGRRTVADLPTASKEGGGYAYDPKARSISPNHVEFVITSGHKTFTVEKGEERTIHRAGDLMVVTTRDNLIVITCMYSHES
jgi:hypothetical protein